MVYGLRSGIVRPGLARVVVLVLALSFGMFCAGWSLGRTGAEVFGAPSSLVYTRHCGIFRPCLALAIRLVSGIVIWFVSFEALHLPDQVCNFGAVFRLGFGLHCGRAGHVSLGCVGVVYRLFCFGVQFLIWTGLVRFCASFCWVTVQYDLGVPIAAVVQFAAFFAGMFSGRFGGGTFLRQESLVVGLGNWFGAFRHSFSGHYAVVRLPDQ